MENKDIEQKKENIREVITVVKKRMTLKDIIYMIAIAIILSIGGCEYYNMKNNAKNQIANYENTIKALNDTITHTKTKDGKDVYSQAAAEMNLKALVESEYFKTLSADQQQFFSELKKVKGLLSATQAELRKQGELMGSIAEGKNPGNVNGDSIAFKLGTVLNFAETDTTKKLQWKASLTIGKKIDFKLPYDYNFNIKTDFVRKKDKSIIVSYTLDDPELQVVKMMNYTIPKEEKLTRIGRWVDKNKKPLLVAGGIISFTAGGYAGYKLAK